MVKERKCRDCGTTENLNEAGTSCMPCSMDRIEENIKSMMKKRGPQYDKWLAAMKARFA